MAEEIEYAVRQEREPVAHVPDEVVVRQPGIGAEVVAVGIGKEGDVGVELDPVDDVRVVARPAPVLPALVDAQPQFVEVAGDLHARRAGPAFHVVAEGVIPLVELRRGPTSWAAERPARRK